jgi:hypothetical protein
MIVTIATELTTERQCVIIRTETDEVSKWNEPDTHAKEGGNVHERRIMASKVLEPYKMVNQNKDYAENVSRRHKQKSRRMTDTYHS